MKMTKPEFEVIRFDAADVIATSGSIAGNLVAGTHYAALTSEVAQAGYPLRNGVRDGEWAYFQRDGADEGYYTGYERDDAAANSLNWSYAWFNNGQWHAGETLLSYTGADYETAYDNYSTLFDPSNTIWRRE